MYLVNKDMTTPNMTSMVKLLENVVIGANSIFDMIEPYSQGSLQLFDQLPPTHQKTIIYQIAKLFRIYEASSQYNSIKNRFEGVDEEKALFNFLELERLELEHPFCMDLNEDKYCIEIFDHNGMTLYKNLESVFRSGYDLLSLFLYDWFELYSRSSKIQGEILNGVKKMRRGEQSTAYLPLHTMKTELAPTKKTFLYDARFVTSIREDDGVIGGYLVVARVVPISNPDEKIRAIHF